MKRDPEADLHALREHSQDWNTVIHHQYDCPKCCVDRAERVMFRLVGGGFVSCKADFEVKTIGYLEEGRALLGVYGVEVHEYQPGCTPFAAGYNAAERLDLDGMNGRSGLLYIRGNATEKAIGR